MQRCRPVLVLFVLAVLTLALAGCDDDVDTTTATNTTTGGGDPGAEEVTSLPIPAQPETASETLGEALAASEEESRRAREARVLEDAQAVGALLNEFWSGELSQTYGVGFDPPDRFEYYYGEEPVSCGGPIGSLAKNAFYCPTDPDEHVAFDLDWFQRYLESAPGGATTFLILAHEWGHAVQDTWEESGGEDIWVPPAQELDADCLAGVFLSRSIEEGTIVEEVGDADAIFGWLYEAGRSPWLGPGSHGTKEERQRAFVNGIEYGTDYCRTNY